MAIPDSESPPPSDLNAAIGGVRRGRELAAQLVALLRPSQDHGYGRLDEAGGLAEEVLASFSTALSALDSGESSEFRRDSATAGTRPPCSDHGGSEGSTEKRKIRPAAERRRGQTRRSQPYAWTRVASKTLKDGYTWRKYGQKEIHGAKYPRCYFRCTHKHDRGCLAARQVQKSEDDPSTFVITYLGHHTCKKPVASLRTGVGPNTGESFLITFGPPDPLDGGGRDPCLPASFPQVKQELGEDALSRNDSSSPEYLMLPELTPLEASLPMTGISSAASDVAGDVTSGFLGMDFTGESFQFEDMLGLEHDDITFFYS